MMKGYPSKAKVAAQHNMQDFADLMNGKNKQELMETNQQKKKDFEKIQNQMRTTKIKEEDFEDELEDQMAESLFQEANKMGIFQKDQGVDYKEQLKKIETEIEKNKNKTPEQCDQINSMSTKQKSDQEDDDNDELYNQVVDDNGNIVRESENDQIIQSNSNVSMYQKEYNEVIQLISNICR